MSQVPSHSNLKKALGFLQQGNILHALHELSELNKHKNTLSPSDQEILIKKIEFTLNLLIDRNIAAAEVSMEDDDEINTAIILFNLLNLYSQLRFQHHSLISSDQKKLEKIAKDFEKWALKVLNTIDSKRFSRRRFKREAPEVFTSYSIIHSIYINMIEPIVKDLTKDKLSGKYSKMIQSVGNNFCDYYIELGIYYIKKKNLVRTKQILNKINLLYNFIEGKKRLKQKILEFQQETMELAADCEMDAGKYYRKSKNFKTSSEHFRVAYIQYRDLNLTSKQKLAKEEYLKTRVQSGEYDLEKARKLAKTDEYSDALFYFQQAIDKFEDINAKRELKHARELLNEYYVDLGDLKYHLGKQHIKDNLQELRKAIDLFDDAKKYYYKADNKKGLKETSKIVQKLQKTRQKILERQYQRHLKASEYERAFLLLEELHYLCYQTEQTSKAQEYAKKMERMKSDINFPVLETIRKNTLNQKPWIRPDAGSDAESKTQIVFPDKQQKPDKLKLPTILNQKIAETTPFFDPLNDQTLMMGQFGTNKSISKYTKLQAPSGLNKTKILSSQELKRIYKIIKKFNQKKYLLNHEVQFLLAYGINLPQDGAYYHKFPRSTHHFYVHQTKKNIPLVLMVPTKNLIKKNYHLGTLASRVHHFIPIPKQEKKPLLSTEILQSHLELAINHPQWSRIIEGFQYSSLDSYLYFLHAIRLFMKQSAKVEIAKYINSSVIAEFMNIPTDQLQSYLEKFEKSIYLADIYSWSKNPNFRLFFGGLLYLRENNFSMTALIWSMIEIS